MKLRLSLRTLLILVSLVACYFGAWEATKRWGSIGLENAWSPCPFVVRGDHWKFQAEYDPGYWPGMPDLGYEMHHYRVWHIWVPLMGRKAWMEKGVISFIGVDRGELSEATHLPLEVPLEIRWLSQKVAADRKAILSGFNTAPPVPPPSSP